jgi:hypothetical protein
MHAPDEAISPTIKLFHAPASPSVGKYPVAIRKLGL